MINVGAPIFVLAPQPRSGTNMLSHLLSAHPSIDRSPVFEDFIGVNACELVDYAENLIGIWGKLAQNERLDWSKYTPDELLVDFGRSLLNFVGPPKPGRHLLLKSPTTEGLPNLQRLFPTGHMLILLRDPRSVAESWARANFEHGSSVEIVGRRWASRMRTLESWLKLEKPALDRARIHFVRFEDLARDPAREYARILEAIGLPLDADSISYAADPPVIGSSFGSEADTLSERRNRPDFAPQRRPDGFDPTVRWRDWSHQTHSRFNRTCGTIMRRWGYTPIRPNSVACNYSDET
jgi:protein-tyrosine sulfotransferase